MCENDASCGSTTSGGGGDLSSATKDLSALPDLADVRDFASGMKGFGDPCGDNHECASGICILSGIGGTCSKLCTNDPCPEGYGCFGVLGAVDPGQVAQVCVINHNQLCTPCTVDSECSTASKDICYDFPTGGKFCGRDCTTVSCPMDYTCTSVTVGGSSFKQCIPVSGACDCNSNLVGSKKSCSITTPFGTCAGSRTCQGNNGWTSCAPPSATDTPDDTFSDDNCDGIDGDLTKGVFVAINDANASSDINTCGAYTKPCKHINDGIQAAANVGLNYVYVQAGIYDEEVILFNGVNVVGGYDTHWVRALRGTPGHEVKITGAFDSGEGQYISVLAHSLVAMTTVMDLTVLGQTADEIAHPGLSSYAVHAQSAKLTLKRVGIFAGNGAKGKAGDPGTSYSPISASAAMNGKGPPSPPGPGDAEEYISDCDTTTRGRGGDPGTNSCDSSGAVGGGAGGSGGTMDSQCCCDTGLFTVCGVPCCGSFCNATGGIGGSAGGQSGGGFGGGGGGGGGGDPSFTGGGGQSGKITNGNGGGATGTSRGSLSGAYWTAGAGTNGALGINGGGGGGGGGSGGDDAGTDAHGAGGGGGGAGGCRASGTGKGGGGGGGSFGVFAYSSTVNATSCDIQLGIGASGGKGGKGGTGQNGGSGAAGGLANGDAKAGAGGGAGGHGGHSGGGGGGNGGISFGIFSYNSTVTQTSNFSGGGSGGGGTGGAAATGGVNDGNAGGDGIDGTPAANIGTCANPGGC